MKKSILLRILIQSVSSEELIMALLKVRVRIVYARISKKSTRQIHSYFNLATPSIISFCF
jgi:hypothetical protein